MKKSTRYAPEVHERAVRLMREHAGEYASRVGGELFDRGQDRADPQGPAARRSTVYRHAARLADPAMHSARAKRDEPPCGKIRRFRDDNFQVHGARKVWRALRRDGEQAARAPASG